jgi:hypothetical protein
MDKPINYLKSQGGSSPAVIPLVGGILPPGTLGNPPLRALYEVHYPGQSRTEAVPEKSCPPS